MTKYSRKAEETVGDAMHRFKKGALKSGSGQKVTSRKQAIAIGISEAREKGQKVPPEKKRKSTAASTAKKKSIAGKSTGRKTTAKKSTGRKSTARGKK